jgi:TolB-like protein/class 3 adenylate cyclase
MPTLMTSEPASEQRRLAAIMFTDVVGYSDVTQRDESLALRLLHEQKRLLSPLFPAFDGRVIETIGDAFFVEFASALQAALCAAQIQKTLHERNALAPPGEEIRLRIGLHVGDVVVSGANVHGDGVNIAARVQQVAPPGGICLSEDVARQVQNKIPYKLLKLGRGELKNIRLPVDIFMVVMPWEKRPAGLADRAGFLLSRRKTRRAILLAGGALAAAAVFLWVTLHTPGTPAPANRIAVLPFLNISRDPGDEYFADGLTEELISNLSKIRDMSVIARTSVFKYKNAGVDIAEIGRALNVGTILEGSVRKSGNTAVITVNLTDVATQKNLWSRDYTREITDVFGVQADISMRIAGMLKVRMLTGDAEKLRQRGTESPDAFRYYLLGRTRTTGGRRRRYSRASGTSGMRSPSTRSSRWRTPASPTATRSSAARGTRPCRRTPPPGTRNRPRGGPSSSTSRSRRRTPRSPTCSSGSSGTSGRRRRASGAPSTSSPGSRRATSGTGSCSRSARGTTRPSP